MGTVSARVEYAFERTLPPGVGSGSMPALDFSVWKVDLDFPQAWVHGWFTRPRHRVIGLIGRG
jgi:hypothetical protein